MSVTIALLSVGCVQPTIMSHWYGSAALSPVIQQQTEEVPRQVISWVDPTALTQPTHTTHSDNDSVCRLRVVCRHARLCAYVIRHLMFVCALNGCRNPTQHDFRGPVYLPCITPLPSSTHDGCVSCMCSAVDNGSQFASTHRVDRCGVDVPITMNGVRSHSPIGCVSTCEIRLGNVVRRHVLARRSHAMVSITRATDVSWMMYLLRIMAFALQVHI